MPQTDEASEKKTGARADQPTYNECLRAGSDEYYEPGIDEALLASLSEGTLSCPSGRENHNVFTPRNGGDAEVELAQRLLRAQIDSDEREAFRSLSRFDNRPHTEHFDYSLASSASRNAPRSYATAMHFERDVLADASIPRHMPLLDSISKVKIAHQKTTVIFATADPVDAAMARAWKRSLCWLWVDTIDSDQSITLGKHYAKQGVTSFQSHTVTDSQLTRNGLWMYIPTIWCNQILRYLGRYDETAIEIDHSQSWENAVRAVKTVMSQQRARPLMLKGPLQEKMLEAFETYVVLNDLAKGVLKSIRWRLGSRQDLQHLHHFKGVRLVHVQSQSCTDANESGTPLSNQRSSGNTSSSSPRTSETSFNAQPKRKRNGKEKADDHVEDSSTDGGGQKDQRPPQKQHRPRINQRYACPFYQNDPRSWADSKACAGDGFKDISKMKEHLQRKHLQPVYCPRCHKIFRGKGPEGRKDAEGDREIHFKSLNACNPALGEPAPPGISDQQWSEIRQRKDTGMSDGAHWQRIYDVLFAFDGTARSPYCIPENHHVAKKLLQMEQPLAETLGEELIQRLLPSLRSTSQDEDQRRAQDIKKAVRDTTHDVFGQFCTASTDESVFDDQQASPRFMQFCTISTGQQVAECQQGTPKFDPPIGGAFLQFLPSMGDIADEAFDATSNDFAEFLYEDVPNVTPVWNHHPVADVPVDKNAKEVPPALPLAIDPQWLVAQV